MLPEKPRPRNEKLYPIAPPTKLAVMLNYIWLGLMVAAVLIGAANDTLDAVGKAAFERAEYAVMKLALPLAGVMALWLGIMRLAEKARVPDMIGIANVDVGRKRGADICITPKTGYDRTDGGAVPLQKPAVKFRSGVPFLLELHVANDRKLVRDFRLLRHQLADVHSGNTRLDRFEFPAILNRRIRFEVIHIHMTRPAIEINHNDGLAATRYTAGSRFRLCPKQIRQCQPHRTGPQKTSPRQRPRTARGTAKVLSCTSVRCWSHRAMNQRRAGRDEVHGANVRRTSHRGGSSKLAYARNERR